MFEALAWIAIGAALLNMWWLYRLQLKVEALDEVYNQLANILDGMTNDKQGR